MAYTKVPKPTGSYTKVDKFVPDLMLLQDGGFILLQDGQYIALRNIETSNWSSVAKT